MAAKRPFRLAPAAKADLRKIWRYTVRRWSPEQAEAYQDQLYAAFVSRILFFQRRIRILIGGAPPCVPEPDC